MFDDNGRDAINFTTGMLFGALIGAAVALLLAPQSGRRTRRQLARTAEDWSDVAGRKLHGVAGDARRITERARRSAEDSGERIADQVSRGRRRLRI